LFVEEHREMKTMAEFQGVLLELERENSAVEVEV